MAAALVLVATFGPFGSQPELPAASQTVETTAADPVPADPATGDAQSVDTVAGVLMASQTSYSRQELPEQVTAVSRMVAGESELSDLPAPWSGADEQPAATIRGAADCVGALPAPSGRLLYVDRAEYEGQPVLVVAWRASSEVEVYVLAAGCTAADTRVLLRATVDAP